eukprot:TRINITY_DN2490_c0_g2_i1.p1 TRINITY_DN2490_c0_g2~~TRINITY_DN2490_c0_g2_i1.p1  ORF type:complete len:732 (+),score=230.60 TRINITY_DN2490_c0_g2_i1:61-2256(+)
MYASAHSPGATSVPGGVDEGWNSDPPESPPPLVAGRRYTAARLSRRPQHGGQQPRRLLPVSLSVAPLDDSGAPAPPALQEHAAVCLGKERLFVHGGAMADGRCSGDLWMMKARKWKRVAAAPQSGGRTTVARRGHTLTATAENMLVLYGGRAEHGEVLGQLMYYDPQGTARWEALDPMKGPHGGQCEPVAHHSAVCHKGRLYFYGGETQSGRYYPLLQSFDMRARAWSQHDVGQKQSVLASLHPSDVPTGRKGHSAHLCASALLASDSMLVFGGQTDVAECTNDVFSFSFEDNRWTKVYSGGVVPAPRAHHSAVCVRDQLVVYGGVGSSGEVFGDCFYLNLVTNTWRSVALRQGIGARCAHTACLWEGRDGALHKIIYGGTQRGVPNITDDARQAYQGYHPSPPPRDKTDFAKDKAEVVVTSTPLQNLPGEKADVGEAASPSSLPRPTPSALAPLGGALLVTIGVAQERKARPKTAPSPAVAHIPIKPTAKSQGRQLFNHVLITSPTKSAKSFLAPAAPDRQPPWTVSTNKANTAREFGDAPEGPYPFRYAKALNSEVVDSVVNRLSDTSHSAMIQETLAKKYVFEPEQQRKPKILTPDAVDRSVDRMYHHQLELQEEYQRTLEAKYIPTQEPKKMTRGDIVNMVHRLGTVPEKKEYWGDRPDERRKVVDLKQSVDRLFYQSVAAAEVKKQTLHDRYAAKPHAQKISTERMVDMVGRLYVVNPINTQPSAL